VLSLSTRFVFATVWIVAVFGALLEILFGLIWASGGIGDTFGRPEPGVARLMSLTGAATFIFSIVLVITLLWRMEPALQTRRDRGRDEITAKGLAALALLLIALGAVSDLTEEALVRTIVAAVLNGPTLVASLLLIRKKG